VWSVWPERAASRNTRPPENRSPAACSRRSRRPKKRAATGEAARRLGIADVDVRVSEILDATADDVERARELLAPLLTEEPVGRCTWLSSGRGAIFRMPTSSSSP